MLVEGADRRAYRAEVIVSWIVSGYWVLSLALVWWTPWTGILWFLSATVGNLVRSLVRRRQRALPAWRVS